MTKISSVGKLRLQFLRRGAALLWICAMLHCGSEGPQAADSPELREPPAQLALSPSNAQLAQDTAQQFAVRGLYLDGRARDLTRQVEWTVADERGDLTPMPADGYLQLARPGRYLVTATYQGSVLTTTVVVTAATVKSVAISPRTPQVAKGLTQAFTAVATFTDGTTQDVTRLAAWAVKDVVGTGVATIDTTGLLLAKNVGKATITARYMAHSSSTTMEVTAATLNTLLVGPANPTVASGTNQQFTATGTFSDGTAADLTAAATWAVADITGSGVAAIDGTGLANGLAVGTAQVSADYLGVTAQTTLTVTPAVPLTIAISPASSSIAKGTFQSYAAIATLTDGSTQDVTAMTAWTATDKTGTGVASVDAKGFAKGNAEGTATIAALWRGHAAAALLTVTPAVLTTITVNPATATIVQSTYRTLVAIGGYSDGSTQDLSATATWTTADVSGTDVASVAAGGRVFGKNVGQAAITASAGAYSASAVVTVSPLTYTALSMTQENNLAFVGDSLKFSALAKLPDGSTRDVSSLATWTVTDLYGTKVASVDSKGTVLALSVGWVQVKATFSGFTATGSLIVPF